MNKVHTQEVIICTKERRGNGDSTPIRIITQVYTKDGELIAEDDPAVTDLMSGNFGASVFSDPNKSEYSVHIDKTHGLTEDEATRLAYLLNETIFSR